MALTKVTGQVIKNTTDVTVGVLTVTNTLAVGGTVSIGGTLTYEDVTNIDSVGLITARNGIVVGSGITLSKDGDIFATGVTTSTTFVGALTGAASKITVTDQSSDTTCFPVFAQGATGDITPHTGTNLTFNSADGTLSATTLSGAVSGTTGTFTDNVDIATSIRHIGDTDTKITFDTDIIHLDTANVERLRITSGGALNVPAGIGPQLRFENQHSVTTDAAISTFDDSSGTLLSLGSNFYFNSSGSETRYNTSEESSGIVMNRNGTISLKTGGTGATATTRLNIDSDGIITKPAHPAFFAHMSATTDHDNGDYLKCNSVSEGVNTGSHYDTSTYKFTAPVAGVYLFFGAANIVASSGEYARSFQVRLYKNGSSQQFQMIRQTLNGLASSYPGTGSYSGIITLAKDDYVQLKVNWETDGNGFGTTESIHLHGTCFGGYLIG